MSVITRAVAGQGLPAQNLYGEDYLNYLKDQPGGNLPEMSDNTRRKEDTLFALELGVSAIPLGRAAIGMVRGGVSLLKQGRSLLTAIKTEPLPKNLSSAVSGLVQRFNTPSLTSASNRDDLLLGTVTGVSAALGGSVGWLSGQALNLSTPESALLAGAGATVLGGAGIASAAEHPYYGKSRFFRAGVAGSFSALAASLALSHHISHRPSEASKPSDAAVLGSILAGGLSTGAAAAAIFLLPKLAAKIALPAAVILGSENSPVNRAE